MGAIQGDAPGDSVTTAIETAWHTILDADSFDPQRQLIDTGADSLRVMQFVLHLEQTLGRKIAYDLLSPETTPVTLARSLREGRRLSAELPRLFYLSGLNGTDYQMVGHLRAALGNGIAVVHARAPGLAEPRALVCDMAATAAWIAADIMAAQPTGDIRLAGYSVGGMQAFETARHLVAAGRRVALLCLLDPIPRRSLARVARDVLRRPGLLGTKLRDHMPRVAPTERKSAKHGMLVDAALRLGAYGLAGKAVRLTEPSNRADAEIFSLWRRRLLATRRWRPRPLEVDALLVLTDDGVRLEAARFWLQYIGGLRIVTVPGSHDLLSRTPIPDSVRSALLQHFEAFDLPR